jgi:hypothetical protein
MSWVSGQAKLTLDAGCCLNILWTDAISGCGNARNDRWFMFGPELRSATAPGVAIAIFDISGAPCSNILLLGVGHDAVEEGSWEPCRADQGDGQASQSAVPYLASMPHNWAKPELAFDRPAREEIIQRVEGFRAHQEKLRREREDYYLERTEKMRAILRDDIERKHWGCAQGE